MIRTKQVSASLASALNLKDGIGLAVKDDTEVFAAGGWQLSGNTTTLYFVTEGWVDARGQYA